MSAPDVACRSCGDRGLERVLDLGTTPLADRLFGADEDPATEPRFPLEVAFCPSCTLVQILATVPGEVLFDADYPYFSSFSDALLAHSRDNALELAATRGLGSGSLVVEVASNDGYLLRNFRELGVPVLGIDPAPGQAAAARAIGVPTLEAFFGDEVAGRLRDDGRRADVLIGNNVLAHATNTNDFVRGVRRLLRDDGVAVFEFPYVRDLIAHVEFDTIYHEHLCYFSVHSVDALFRRHGLHVNEVRRLPIHGGSLRVYAEPRERVGASVRALLDEERALGMHQPAFYQGFAARVRETTDALLALLRAKRAEGARIAAYGAAAKGATLLNFAGIDTDLVEFVVDRNVHKHGRKMPGQHQPILPPEALLERAPDYTLLLAWNFRDEILAQQDEYRRRGGRFIVPVPVPEVV